jgi:hypothetical protein
MYAVARCLRTHKTEVSVTIGVAALIITIGTLLRGYDQPATIRGIQWIVAPVARFLSDGGDTYLALVATSLGLACGLLVAWARTQAVRAYVRR